MSLTCVTIAIDTKVKKGENNIKVFVSFLTMKVKRLSIKKITNNKFSDLFRLKDLMINFEFNNIRNTHKKNKKTVKYWWLSVSIVEYNGKENTNKKKWETIEKGFCPSSFPNGN